MKLILKCLFKITTFVEKIIVITEKDRKHDTHDSNNHILRLSEPRKKITANTRLLFINQSHDFDSKIQIRLLFL